MSELKKCPFCGNIDVFVAQDWEIEGNNPEDGSGYYAVICDYRKGGCGASGGYRETIDEAQIAWNNRESEGGEG